MIDFLIGANVNGFEKTLAEKLNCEYKRFIEEYYPDGEPCPRILAEYSELEDKNIAVVARFKYPNTPENLALYLHNILRVISNLSDENLYNVKSIDLILPYFVLGRQDHNPRLDMSNAVRLRDKGKDVGYKTLVRMFKGCGVRRIITFNPHFHISEGTLRVEGIEIVILSGIATIGNYYQTKIDRKTIILARDEKAEGLARQLSSMLNLEQAVLKKTRLSEKDVEYKSYYNAEGKNILIIDDLTTGAGLPATLNAIKNPGEIYFSVIHATLSSEGYKILTNMLKREIIKEFVATNTTLSPFSKVDIIPELAKLYMAE